MVATCSGVSPVAFRTGFAIKNFERFGVASLDWVIAYRAAVRICQRLERGLCAKLFWGLLDASIEESRNCNQYRSISSA
jgi:hypothetical protein